MRIPLVYGAWGIAVVCIVGLGGCGRPQTNTPISQNVRTITIKGSDTMVHLATAWAEHYMQGKPDADVSVTGGGSGTGIAALINGTADICAASRDMSAKEKEEAHQHGITPKETIVARDGIAVIVHPSNPIDELTLDQLKQIYTGMITDWGKVGGTPGEIILLSRESSSGTFVFFQEHVLKKADYAIQTRLMPATSSIIQSTAADKQSIGYAGLGYAVEAKDTVKILRIKADDTAGAILPSDAMVRDGTYSIARPLFFYTNEKANDSVNAFLTFCLGEEGQRIVQETGFVRVR